MPIQAKLKTSNDQNVARASQIGAEGWNSILGTRD